MAQVLRILEATVLLKFNKNGHTAGRVGMEGNTILP